MDVHGGELEVLSEAECLRLLGTTRRARIATSAGALPVVVPVDFTVTEHQVWFSVRDIGPRTEIRDGVVVAFQAEGDEGGDSTWSVHVTGVTCCGRPDPRQADSPITVLRLTAGVMSGWRRTAPTEVRPPHSPQPDLHGASAGT